MQLPMRRTHAEFRQRTFFVLLRLLLFFLLFCLLMATRSSSSFFLLAYELLLPLAALMSSSARHSAIDLTFRNDASRAPVVSRAMAWLTRRRGETSTACRRTVPAEPIRVESSRGPQLTMASTAICIGFWSVMMWI